MSTMKIRQRGRKPITQIRLYWLLKREPYLTLREAARRLGISYASAKMAAYRLRQNGNGVTKWCPKCLLPTVGYLEGEHICSICGVVLLEEPLLGVERPDEVYSRASSLLQADKGLGLNVEEENRLARKLRLKTSTTALLSFSPYGDPGFLRAVLRKVLEWGNFPSQDFEVSEAAAKLARRLSLRAMMRRAELTRGTIRQVALEVLREVYKTYGPSRCRPPADILGEIVSQGAREEVIARE